MPIEQIVAAASALLGALLGAVGGYMASSRQASASIAAAREQARASVAAARNQIRADTIVASRRQWIDELRAQVSTMVGQLLSLQIALEKQTDEAHGEWLKEVVTASALEGKIALMLNPNEEAHEALVAAIRAPLNGIRMGKQINWGDASTAILDAGRVVLKDAWDQVLTDTALLALPEGGP